MVLLYPRSAPPALGVGSVQPLGDNAPEALLGRGREQRSALTDEGWAACLVGPSRTSGAVHRPNDVFRFVGQGVDRSSDALGPDL
jgi:hypothetical protein